MGRVCVGERRSGGAREREEEDRERRGGRVCVVREIEGEYVLREKKRKRVCVGSREKRRMDRERRRGSVCVFAYGRGWIYI